jgi:hypothetical protein
MAVRPEVDRPHPKSKKAVAPPPDCGNAAGGAQDRANGEPP